ncbi:MAG: NAD(P)-binding domain-containing protein, partial [Desulfobacterales bacterium]
MKKIGLVGLGDMGIGMAKNILGHGFELTGYDLREERRQALAELGGKPAEGVREVAENSDAVFIMVLNGPQVKDVVLGEYGFLDGLKPGSIIIVSATIHPSEIRAIEPPVVEKG